MEIFLTFRKNFDKHNKIHYKFFSKIINENDNTILNLTFSLIDLNNITYEYSKTYSYRFLKEISQYININIKEFIKKDFFNIYDNIYKFFNDKNLVEMFSNKINSILEEKWK